MASRADTPKPPLLDTHKPPLPDALASPAAAKVISLGLQDYFTILALVISAALAYGEGDTVFTLAEKAWAEEGVVVFCAKFSSFTVAYGCAFAGVIFLWQKAATYKEEEYEDRLRYIIPSILIICAGYVALEYLQGDVADVQVALLMLGKSASAATLWVLLVAACYGRAVISYDILVSRGRFEPQNLDTLVTIVLICCYSACAAAYAKQGWMAETDFWIYWGKVVVLAELPVAAAVACTIFKDMVVDYESTVMNKADNTLVSVCVAVVVASGLMYLAASSSASAHETDGSCGFTCACQVEAAITLAAFSCLVLYHTLKVIYKLQGFHRLAKTMGGIIVILVVAYIVLHGHRHTLPKWIQSALPAGPSKVAE